MSLSDEERELTEEVATHRTPEYDIDPVFVNRWSPRAMTGEPLDEAEFLPLFEAARWAPSAYNNQHWRFVYATRDDDEWDTFIDLLSENNKIWATDASVLVAIFSKTTFEHNGEPALTHSFDTGAAWQNLALEGTRRDLALHPMAGFDWDRIHDALGVPKDEFDAEAMVAIGKRAKKDTLPEDLQEREAPSDRKPLADLVSNGQFE